MPPPVAVKNKENMPAMEGRKRLSTEDGSSPLVKPALKKSRLSRLDSVDDEPKEILQAVGAKSSAVHEHEQAGRILELEMQNFLVYEKRKYEFGRHVNFVTGANGSGKSSMASAIRVALGRKVGEGGGKLENMIKRGAPFARIRLVLSNEGANSYYPDEWGKRITIERTIKKNQFCFGYRIISEDKRTIRQTKKILDNILARFKIQVDNPVCFMSQKTSKDFFSSYSDSDRYQFFYKAYGYAFAEKVYNQDDRHSIEIVTDLFARKTKELVLLKKDLAAWQERGKESKSDGDLQAQLDEVHGQEMLWHRQNVVSSIAEATRRIRENASKMDKLKQDFEVAEAFVFTPSELGIITRPKPEKELKTKQTQLTQVRKRIKQLRTQARDHTVSRAKILADSGSRRTLLDFGDSISQNNSFELDSSHRENDGSTAEDIAALEAQQMALDKELRDLTISVQNLQNGSERLAAAQLNINRLQDELHSVENAESSWNASYHTPENVQKAIAQATWASGCAPLGPLGSFISFRLSEMTTAADQALCADLPAYLVYSYEDERQLINIFTECGIAVPQQPLMYIINATHLDSLASPILPDLSSLDGACTVQEIVKCTNPILTTFMQKCLDIGRIVLLKTAQAAAALAASSLPDVDQIYDMTGRCYSKGPGDVRNTCPIPRPAVLSPDEKQLRLRELRKREEELLTQIAELTRNLNRLPGDQQLLNIRGVELSKVAEKLHTLKENTNSTRRQSSRAASTPRKSGKITAQEAATGLCSLSVRNHSTQSSVLAEANQELSQAIEFERCLVEDVTALVGEVEDFRKKKQAEERERINKTKELKHLQSRMDAVAKEIQKLTKDKSAHESRLEALTADLRQRKIEFRTTTPRASLAEIVAEKLKLEKQQAALMTSSDKYSKEYCRSKVLEYQKDIAEKEIHVNDANNDVIKLMLENNNYRLGNHSSNVSRGTTLATDKVKSILRERGFEGRFTFDHEKKTLLYTVRVPTARAGYFAKLETLSGGEKSYAMAAFLGAMWREDGEPFRVLDEFDVCMDSKNRESAMKCLIQQAANDDVQCIFLSPTPIDFASVMPDGVAEDFMTCIETGQQKPAVESDDSSD